MGGASQLEIGSWTGLEPCPQRWDITFNVHGAKTSTQVLNPQPQKTTPLRHIHAMDTNTRKIVAFNVRRLREARSWNQTVLGEKAGLGQTTVSSIEQPEGKSPNLESLTAIAKALGVPEWTLLVDGSALDAVQLKTLDHLVHTYADLPATGKKQVQRVAEAEERYSKAS